MKTAVLVILLAVLPWRGVEAVDPSPPPVGKAGYVVVQGGPTEKPIILECKPGLTLMAALGVAGNFTIYSLRHARLVRWDGKTITIDLKRLKGHPEEDLKLVPGDVVQVPDTMF